MARDIKTVFGSNVIGREKIVSDGEDRIVIKSFGVTSLLFDDGKTKLLFDAMVTRPPLLKMYFGKIGPDRALVKKLVAENRMEDLQAIFVSHTHYDHVLDVPAFALETGAAVYGTASALNVARGNGVPEEKLYGFEGGESFRIGDFCVSVIRSLHSPAKWYNNDLGVEITTPVVYPVNGRRLTEGGSYDFYVTHGERSFLIRPSCNYIPNTFDGVHADILFFGVGQMSKMTDGQRAAVYRETVGKVRPDTVIPIHWDVMTRPIGCADRAWTVFDRPLEAMKWLMGQLTEDGVCLEILLAAKPTEGQ